MTGDNELRTFDDLLPDTVPGRTAADLALRAVVAERELRSLRRGVQAAMDLHRKVYDSASDEVWDQDARCDECRLPYPCPTRRCFPSLASSFPGDVPTFDDVLRIVSVPAPPAPPKDSS